MDRNPLSVRLRWMVRGKNWFFQWQMVSVTQEHMKQWCVGGPMSLFQLTLNLRGRNHGVERKALRNRLVFSSRIGIITTGVQ